MSLSTSREFSSKNSGLVLFFGSDKAEDMLAEFLLAGLGFSNERGFQNLVGTCGRVANWHFRGTLVNIAGLQR